MATISEAMTLAVQHHQQGRLEAAEQIYRQVLQVQPNHPDALHLLGLIALQAGRLDVAEHYINRAIAVNGNEPMFHGNLGNVFRDQGKFEEAVIAFRRALELNPDFADAHFNLGNALDDLGKLNEAVSCYRRALELTPDDGEVHTNLGRVLEEQGLLDEAIACYRRAVNDYPDRDKRYDHLGHALVDQGESEQPVIHGGGRSELQPDSGLAHLNLALAYLRMGNFSQGWHEYEWRFACPEGNASPTYPRPTWNGRPLEGRRILLWTEQGLGDAIQFVRYAPLVQARGGRVMVHCPAALARILATCPGVDQVVVHGQELPEFDCHISLLSLPRVFGTTLESIPASIPYLSADPELVQRWGNELGSIPGLKIGIAWQGNPAQKHDRSRSFPVTQFESLAKIPGVRLFSLQKNAGAEQLHGAGSHLPITDLGPRLHDLMDTAAVLKNLDLLICPCTSVAHLAGAIGVPVWVALSFAGDWRWLLDRVDSPWYPTLKLYRQSQPRNWPAVFDQIAGDVRRLVDV